MSHPYREAEYVAPKLTAEQYHQRTLARIKRAMRRAGITKRAFERLQSAHHRNTARLIAAQRSRRADEEFWNIVALYRRLYDSRGRWK